MKKLEKFKSRTIKNMDTVNGGKRVDSGILPNGGHRIDKIKRNGEFITNVGLFDGPRD